MRVSTLSGSLRVTTTSGFLPDAIFCLLHYFLRNQRRQWRMICFRITLEAARLSRPSLAASAR
jgi:hypothetical protein